jgi:hypothetical protein
MESWTRTWLGNFLGRLWFRSMPLTRLLGTLSAVGLLLLSVAAISSVEVPRALTRGEIVILAREHLSQRHGGEFIKKWNDIEVREYSVTGERFWIVRFGKRDRATNEHALVRVEEDGQTSDDPIRKVSHSWLYYQFMERYVNGWL